MNASAGRKWAATCLSCAKSSRRNALALSKSSAPSFPPFESVVGMWPCKTERLRAAGVAPRSLDANDVVDAEPTDGEGVSPTVWAREHAAELS